jgi:hypothetical protein
MKHVSFSCVVILVLALSACSSHPVRPNCESHLRPINTPQPVAPARVPQP